MPSITSRNNGMIVDASKLKEKKHRDKTGLFLLSGKKLLVEAANAGIKLKYVFCTEKNLPFSRQTVSDAEIYTVSEPVLDKLTDEQSPEGVCAVAEKPDLSFDIKSGEFVLVCDRLSDPGNAGSVLRSARAFGAGAVVFCSGCADIFSPKVLRGAMGAAFAHNIITGADIKQTVKELTDKGFKVYAAALHTEAVPLCKTDLSGSCAVVIGNEGQGLSADVISACGKALYIEMEPECESLNAATAASVIMYKRYTGG